MATLWQLLAARAMATRVAFDLPIRAFLESCTTTAGPAPGPDLFAGQVQLAVVQNLPLLSLDFKAPVGEYDYRLEFRADGFSLWLPLDTLAGAVRPEGAAVFDFAAGLPGHVLTAAVRKTDAAAGTEWLEAAPAGGPAQLEGVRVSLLIEGRVGGSATLRLSPTTGGVEGQVALKLVPPTVLVGSSGFGIELPADAAGEPAAIVIDDSELAATPGTTLIGGSPVATPADEAPWRGIALRALRLYLPQQVPFFGGHAVDAHLQLGIEPPGIDLAITTRVPPTESRPGIDVRIECRDPTARGFGGFAPTLVEVAMRLPLNGRDVPVPAVGGLNLLAGQPVVARARFSRLPPAPTTTLALGIESQGGEGIVSVHAPEGGTAAKVLIAAAALATAIIADEPPEGADASGVVLHALLVAALGASAFLKDKGKVVIHGVELQSSGAGLPVGGALKLVIDYSVDVVVVPIKVGALSVALDEAQPMRVRNRKVGVTLDPNASGTAILKLDFSRADMEIEDPGLWQVHGPASLFDILGTRSGRGSMWLEVDLRFKLDLGPVRVSGATIRATLDAGGGISASLQGLAAEVDVPGVLKGSGKLQLVPGGGFQAAIGVNVVPLNLAASAELVYAEVATSPGWWLFLRLATDLPGPVPIANTGLGLFGVAGSFGVNAKPMPPPGLPDPVTAWLAWDASKPLEAFGFAADQLTIGFEAVIGTVADFGFSFSAKGGLFLTVPDVALRATLWGRLLAPRLKVTERPDPGTAGVSFRGVGVVDPGDGVTVGLKGQLIVPVLMEAVLPLGARFPKQNPGDWYVYLGADGAPWQGRTLGPVRVTVLPDLFPQRADTYLMLRGSGISGWPYNRPGIKGASYGGFVAAFGFAFEVSFGPRPFAWAEVNGGADILIATQPLTLAGFGRIAGSLHLGPFSVGVDALLAFIAPDNAPKWIHARVCGRIDLLFDELEDCAEISIGSKPARQLPPPSVHPLDAVEGEAITGDLAYLIDGRYERLHALPRVPVGAPMVWPDTLVHLAFGIVPRVAGNPSGGQFDDKSLGMPAAQPVGNEMLRYEWTLAAIDLVDVTGDENGPGVKVAPALPYSAAWQKGKAGSLGTKPQAGELVLFTWDGTLSLARLADGGAGLAASPLDDPAALCRARAEAGVGWAVGFGATPETPGMRMPPDPIDPDPCLSRFSALCSSGTTLLPGVLLGAGNAGLLPAPLWFEPLAQAAWPLACAPDRGFAGWLDLGRVCLPRELGQRWQYERTARWNSARIVPSAPLASARLWVAIDAASLDAVGGVTDPLLRVASASGDWTVDQRSPKLAGGRIALRFVPRVAAVQAAVDLLWRLNLPLAVIGLGGITQAALDATAALNAYLQNEASKLAEAAAKQPQQSETSGGAVRAVLDAGHTYRLDVDLRWEGWLYEQDDAGNRVEVKPKPAQDPTHYLPAHGTAQPTRRSYFFKTTPGVAPPPAGQPRNKQKPLYGDLALLPYLHRRQDLFEPEMLERHLLGYTPAQSEPFRFADDPVQAHFGAGHVKALAAVYGFDLTLDLRRVDVPPPPGAEPNLLDAMTALWLPIEEPSLLSQASQFKYAQAIAGVCPQPKPGATLKAPPVPLAARAWYEVFVRANEKGTQREAGRLSGITFRTSRWRSPRDMLEGLGFGTGPVPGRVSGDVALAATPALAPGVVEGEDAAYEAALAAIGLEGWPLADEPRVSQLWVHGEVDGAPGWLVAGVLVESPEPIHRPGRVTLAGLVATMRGDAAPAVDWQVRRRDRSGSRLLALTTTPFVPRRWAFLPWTPPHLDPLLVLRLAEHDAAPGVVVEGALALNTQPAFAGED